MLTYTLDVNSIIINGIKMAPYIVSAKYGFHKLWGKQSGRNLAQSVVGSFNIFPKITLTFKKLNQEEIELILPILNSSEQSLRYYDPEFKRVNTISTYTNDVEYSQNRIGKIKNFDIAFISRKRRIK